MPITEDDVKNGVAALLKRRGFKTVEVRLGTRKGPDVEAVNPDSGRRLVVECKGETEAANQWDRSWRNASGALFNAIRLTEKFDDDVAIALPDTDDYRRRMGSLEEFCARQGISVYWVAEDGAVRQW
jgi:hypothetical protein